MNIYPQPLDDILLLMRKKIAIGVAAVVLAVPVFAAADTNVQAQLISLYQQLIQILSQELGILQAQVLTISPQGGSAPFTATFTLNNPKGTEAIDFGDGHSTGSSGCTKNAQGYCDLSKSVEHTYSFPGTYKVTVYMGSGKNAQAVATQTVTVK
jgi:hypothetical protein